MHDSRAHFGAVGVVFAEANLWCAGLRCDRAQANDWESADRFIRAIFVSFRNPAEQAPDTADDPIAKFQFMTKFMAEYRDVMIAICDRMDGTADLLRIRASDLPEDQHKRAQSIGAMKAYDRLVQIRDAE